MTAAGGSGRARRAFGAASFCVFLLAACGGSGGDTIDAAAVSIPGGPGTPAISFTAVPRYGSFDVLRGQVLHVEPKDYKVAVFINVPAAGGWWTKPYFAQPLTAIDSGGAWTCDVTTGGIDERATAIAAFLLPNGYAPPLLAGAPQLPRDLVANAAAMVQVSR